VAVRTQQLSVGLDDVAAVADLVRVVQLQQAPEASRVLAVAAFAVAARAGECESAFASVLDVAGERQA